MISKVDILMGRDAAYPLNENLTLNLNRLVECINKLERLCPLTFKVSSGYRPAAINATVKGAAPNSAHAVCMAVDVVDPRGHIDDWCMDNLDKLEQCGLYLESPKSTPTWCHLTTRAPHSGKRVFTP